MKTLGWFQILILSFLGAQLFSFETRALNLDFDKEIQKREVVSVRLAGDLKPSKAPQDKNQHPTPIDGPEQKKDASGTFSVRLIPISR